MPKTSNAAGLRPGESLDVTVEKGVYRGLGLARHEGQVVFVPRGRPGDRLRVRVESVTPGYARAVTESVLSAGPALREAPCPFFVQCGGCAYQHADYAAQLRLKEEIVRESLARAGVSWDAPIDVFPSPELGWRTRAGFHVQEAAGTWRLGLHVEGTHRVVDLERCLQVSEAMNRTQRALARVLGERPHQARHVATVDMAESMDGGALVVALETDFEAAQAPPLAALADAAPWTTGFGAVVGPGHRRQYVHLRGEPYVESTVLGLRFRAHVRSFFQANRFVTEELARAVVEATPRGGTVLDLYAGVGLFALPLARTADAVRAVEINPFAVEDGTVNARRAGLRNVTLREGDVRKGLAAWPIEAGERIVLDPPRTGAGAEVVRAVAGRKPAAVVYVSCDPPTLGRDLRAFASAGYRVDLLRAFDMFPDTHHVETLARLVPV
jgi:tRNA/tmRNA/rRNA uracil-C5-methylase (TrmA/RlmC/RlmD family)